MLGARLPSPRFSGAPAGLDLRPLAAVRPAPGAGVLCQAVPTGLSALTGTGTAAGAAERSPFPGLRRRIAAPAGAAARTAGIAIEGSAPSSASGRASPHRAAPAVPGTRSRCTRPRGGRRIRRGAEAAGSRPP
ncbi:hypothetical protein GCM10027440_34200 [Nocardiopsis coralliicola]